MSPLRAFLRYTDRTTRERGEILETAGSDYGDLSDVAGRLMLPFATVQQSLQKGRAQDHASPSLITDYNAEANLLTAFICHADGLKPAQVCHRSVIRSILKHIH